MEGTVQPLARSRSTGARTVALVCFLLLCAGGTMRAEDYLVAERPSAFTVYNGYEQRATPEERTLLEPFVPMKIVVARGTLSDGVTPCTRVAIGRTVLFLLRDERGALSGELEAGTIRIIRNALVIGDTVQVVRGKALPLVHPISTVQSALADGELLVRVFREQRRTYVRTIDPPFRFGWVQLEPSGEGATWATARTPVSIPTTISPALQDSVRARLGRVNAVIAGLYRQFNAETRQQRQAPIWKLDVSASRLVCRLEGTPSPASFAESSRILARDLENLTLGSGMTVSAAPGVITIALR
jgi:hypothetical protein